MKTVKFLVASTPDCPEMGFGDYVEVLDNNVSIFGSHASTCPNPYKLNNSGHPIPWELVYGWIAEGQYIFKCISHDTYGKCLLINNGGEVPSRVPNANHSGRLVLSELFVHCGALNSKNKKWRASRGCCTVPTEYWSCFIGKFEVGDTGKLIIEKLIESR